MYAWSFVVRFNEVQKNCIGQMGFGGILNMKMIKFPGALSCFVLMNFSSETKKMVLQKGVIDVTKESLTEIIGFPLGRKQFSKLPFKTKEDKCYEEWTNQFDDKKMIRLQDIKMKIVSTNKADMNFRMNFIALRKYKTSIVICYWISEKIKMRETFEKEELGDFGTGDFNDKYIDEELNEEVNLIATII
uniref:Uncharacterized protein n=1 Tax=Lactuca sativa TaxID=4236 RepID=A0A9R1XFU3_LACSA|nr:hypothetical protein LSAT_V11C400178070 [Lactuca sativa]